jgi:ABC-type multidrug transport system ATPase subunit
MDEAMRCDRVALIQDGSILTIDTPQNIRNGFGKRLFMIRSSNKYKLILTLRKFEGTNTVFPFGDSVHVTFTDNKYDESLMNFLHSEGIGDVTIEEAEASIEDRFLELMMNK